MGNVPTPPISYFEYQLIRSGKNGDRLQLDGSERDQGLAGAKLGRLLLSGWRLRVGMKLTMMVTQLVGRRQLSKGWLGWTRGSRSRPGSGAVATGGDGGLTVR
jgi:hypothetical protein